MGDCSVCCEAYNKSDKKCVECPYCDFKSCRACVATYYMGGTEELHCMGCRHGWTDDYVYNVMTSKFYKGDYRKHHVDILVEREKSLLPSTQDAVTNEIQRRDNEKQAALINIELQNKRNERITLERQIHQLKYPTKGPERKVISRCDCVIEGEGEEEILCRGWNVQVSQSEVKCFVCNRSGKLKGDEAEHGISYSLPRQGIVYDSGVLAYIFKKGWHSFDKTGFKATDRLHGGVPQMAIRRADIYAKFEQDTWGLFMNYVFDALLDTRSQVANSPGWRDYGKDSSRGTPKNMEVRMENTRVKYLRNEITWPEMYETLLSIKERYDNTRQQYEILCMYIKLANYILSECMRVDTNRDGNSELIKWMSEYEELRVHVNAELRKVAYKPLANGVAYIYRGTWRLSMGWRDIWHYIPEELLETELYKSYKIHRGESESSPPVINRGSE